VDRKKRNLTKDMKVIFKLFILLGFLMLFYEYTIEKLKCSSSQVREDENNLPLDKKFERMFAESSTWNNYDTSTINKIYTVNDINTTL